MIRDILADAFEVIHDRIAVRQQSGYRFGGIEHAAAANGDNHVNRFAAKPAYRLVTSVGDGSPETVKCSQYMSFASSDWVKDCQRGVAQKECLPVTNKAVRP